jgi:ABC-type multidrug transport system fused ATPase/permease subunit
MILETLGVGLVIPALALLTARDLAASYPSVVPLLERVGNPGPRELVVLGMLALVSVYLIKALFLGFLAWQQTRFAFGLQRQLSHRLFDIYLRQPYSFHLRRNSAELIHNVINQVGSLTSYGVLPGIIFLNEGFALVGLGCLLFAIEPLGALLSLGVLGAAGWGFHQFTHHRIARWGAARVTHEALRLQHVQQGLGGVKEVKLLGREEQFLAQYRRHNDESSRAGQSAMTLQQLPRLWLELIAIVGLAILVLTMVLQDRPLEGVVGTLAVFAAAGFRLIPSMNRLMVAVLSLRYCGPVIDTLYAELQLAEPTAGATSGQSVACPATGVQREIRLSNITFTYENACRPALDGLSIVIHKGESVGFIGSSGAGKSTLVDITLGLLKPDRGEVEVDGQDIQLRLRDWQAQIGYVPQFIYLTDDSLRRNVAFGLKDGEIDEAAVWRAIRAARLEDFVRTQPAGLETEVGERGVRLSGGQRQRIGIARALYHDPAVLVLDEATSSLDTETERGVMEAVTALRGSKTILIVAHRLSTVEHCNRLYRLEDGVLVAEGSLELASAGRNRVKTR